jgi:hypothetical protein
MSTLKSRITQTMLALLAAATGLRGQEPCSDLLQSLERQLTEQRQTPYDRGSLIRCGTDNSGWHPPAAGENRVVYFGDQVTDIGYRESADSFSAQSGLNPGIAGQTTDQVLIRFRRDVIDLYNKVAVNLVGVNDIVGIAPAIRIRVVLVSGTPVCGCFTKSTPFQRWQERIPEVNELIQKHWDGGGAVYLEYDSAMADGNNLKQELTSESVLPNNTGYGVMALLAEEAVADSLHR